MKIRKTLQYSGIALLVCFTFALAGTASESGPKADPKERISAELKAMAERPAQTKCPISGEPISGKNTFTYMGHNIQTCCPDCVAKVKKDPLSAILKIRLAGEEPALAEGFSHQTTCPVRGGKVADTVYEVRDNILVKFCCAGCEEGFKKNPEKTAKEMLDQKIAPTLITLEQKACPVSGGPVSKDMFTVFEGKKIGLCCAACKGAVDAKAAEYMQTLRDEGIVLASSE